MKDALAILEAAYCLERDDAEDAREPVQAREAARRGGGERLWPALVAGRWTLVDSYTAGGTRHVIACENSPGAAHLRALAPEERLVIEHALSGRASKWIALELGLSEPTVARILQRALRRLGVAQLSGLAGVRAAVFEPLDDGLAVARLDVLAPLLARLTPAQREIACALIEGHSLRAIAARRRRSVRTVAHQVAAVYRLLAVSSRRELISLLS